MPSLLKRLADNRSADSMATELRRKRFALFQSLLERVHGEISILDVGGTAEFWRMMEFADDRVRVTLLNQSPAVVDRPPFRSVAGDARDMGAFTDRQFDIVFSNSVIEHVGTFADQHRMASEVRRVGRRYFVQTPNKYFPIEPHFLVPGFQFLPLSIRASLLARRDLGWYARARNYEHALQEVSAVRLLSEREFRELFPEGRLYKERFFGWTKSFVAYHGWEP